MRDHRGLGFENSESICNGFGATQYVSHRVHHGLATCCRFPCTTAMYHERQSFGIHAADRPHKPWPCHRSVGNPPRFVDQKNSLAFIKNRSCFKIKIASKDRMSFLECAVRESKTGASK